MNALVLLLASNVVKFMHVICRMLSESFIAAGS